MSGRAVNIRSMLDLRPFVLVVIAGCGSGSGSAPAAVPDGSVSTTAGEDASPSTDATLETDGASSGGSSGSGSRGPSGGSGSASSSGSVGSGGDDANSGAEAGATSSGADVLMMHKHVNRDGLFVDAAFAESTLKGKTLSIDPTFAGIIAGNAYASPLYVAHGFGGKGTFYVVTESNNVYALDEATGTSSIPVKNAGAPARSTGCPPSNISPLGISGTPAIDLDSRLIVFDAATGDAKGVLAKHTIHAWSIDDFSEKWSFDVTTLVDPSSAPFATSVQNQRSAVLIVGGVAYVSYGGHYGDCGDYRGWVVGVPLDATTATVASRVKSYVVPAAQSGIWAAGGPSSDGTDIFVATGNTNVSADLDTMRSGWKGAYSVIRLNAGPVFAPGSTNFWHAVSDDSGHDDDLGGSAPLVVDAPAIAHSKLLVQLGKDQDAYVIDRTNMGGEMSPLASAHVMTGDISNAAAWGTTPTGTYVAMVSNGGAGGYGCKTGSGNLVVIQLSATAQITVPWCASVLGGGSPSITSSDGTNDMLVWTVGTDGGGNASGQMHAWDLASGTPVVTGSDPMAGTRHFTTPIFVHGRAFAIGDNRLYALKP